MRRPFRSRCFGTCHFCIKTSRHGYKLHAIVCKLQELKLQYSVISYLSYHSFNILDDFPKSDITYFLFITVPSAVRHPPSAVRIRRPHPHFTESLVQTSKTQGESTFPCTWYVTAVTFMSRTVKKIWNSNCFIFQTTWATKLEMWKPIYLKMPFTRWIWNCKFRQVILYANKTCGHAS